MRATVNGEAVDLPDGLTVQSLLLRLKVAGIAWRWNATGWS